MLTATQYERVKTLFLEAKDQSQAEQARVVEQAEAEGPGIGAGLRRMLASAPAASSFLEEPLEIDGHALSSASSHPGEIAAEAMQSLAESEATPTRIGRYTVQRRIGVGGMGAVYEACQEQPQRIVAVKVIRADLTSTSTRRRFQHEVEVLGRLEHAGIAHIHDAGVADIRYDDGATARRPYFAMELVKGSVLTEYASERDLDVRRRLQLMVEVCGAVHHAHQKGVIHRDLKPGNILVNESGQPKILDFGVARATDGDVQTVTMQTTVGQLIGTIPYMSPEQLRGSSTDLDTRSDVYALGVILYELLSGCLPHDVRGCTITEAVRRLDLEDPPRLASINAACRGDLETIVHMALQREKDRRYQSAAELATDLRRYLAHEPIGARPATALYQLRKLARRHRGATLGLGLALMAIVLGAAGITWFALDAAAKKREARWLAYRASVSVAEGALVSYDVPAARNALAEAPEEYRGWEWDHLSSRLTQWDLEFESSLDTRGNVCASPDGTLIASARDDGTVGVWDVATGRLMTIHDLSMRVTTLAKKAPDGIAAGATDDGRVVRFSLSDGEMRSVIGDTEAGPILDVSVCDDGSRVCTLHERSVSVWEAATGAKLFASEFEWTPDAGDVAVISHAGSHLAAGGFRSAQVFDLDVPQEPDTIRLLDTPRSLAFAPDDGLLAAGASSQNVHLLRTGTCRLADQLRGHRMSVDDVDFLPDGALISYSRDGVIKVWDGEPDWDCFTLHAPPQESTRSITPLDDRRFVSSAAGQTPMLRWSRSAADPTLLGRHTVYAYRLAWSPDSRLLASGPFHGGERISVWDVATGAEVGRIPAVGDWNGPLVFSQDGAHLLTSVATADDYRAGHGKAALYDTSTWREVERYEDWPVTGRPDDAVLARMGAAALRLCKRRVFSADGTLCAYHHQALLHENGIWVVDSAGNPVVELSLDGLVEGIAFSPDGRFFAAVCEDNVAIIWSLPSFSQVHRLEHRATPYAIAFSPDGERIATGGMDGVIHIWDAQIGQLIVDLRGHMSYVYDLAFSPDGRYLASAGGDMTVRLWRTHPGPIGAWCEWRQVNGDSDAPAGVTSEP